MNTMTRCGALLLGLCLLAATPAAQKTVDLDVATIADINAAFAKGTLTSERLTQMFLAH